ncbi:MAG: CofH family radical SAM protein [Bacteroidales bacterium]|jgi:cyclic dehypoxanthinyl futalosine synthase|nr:CofH family radical SAM protein [Bacteroidales bacterium]MDY0196526.1 CofH family radical SAM protein [Tenuifilaceae bacterium]
MELNNIYSKALKGQFLSNQEGVSLYCNAPLANLMLVANELRKTQIPGNKVTWQIDRNVNITNVCIAGCKFCNFHCGLNDDRVYITSLDEYRIKINEMLSMGGEQLLLQGGLHPKLGLGFYKDLFSALKKEYPQVKLHALGPPEIAHIARLEKMTTLEVLNELRSAGLESLPGGGAEILVDRVRKKLSPGKPSAKQWLDVMAEAHQMGLLTTATMMYGHIETIEERIEHLVKIRDLQSQKPNNAIGFSAFICWPYQSKGTKLEQMGVTSSTSIDEHIRMVALSRIMLPNVKHIQASWLTVGVDAAQLCLNAGADDMGSIMIEENVVSSAGATNWLDAYSMQRTIVDAGFEPQLRNQAYEQIALPGVYLR